MNDWTSERALSDAGERISTDLGSTEPSPSLLCVQKVDPSTVAVVRIFHSFCVRS